MEQDTSRFSELARTLKREKLPRHVAIIMDGNGRWARERSRPRVFGHRKGAQSVRAVVEGADLLGIKVLSLFAFSEENWGRPEHEVAALMSLLNTYLRSERAELNKNNVQFRYTGRIQRLPEKTQRILRETAEMLSGNTGLVLNLALSYGGRSEIVDAARDLARRVQAGELRPQEISSELFQESISNGDLPDPDLLIRTSGEHRVSNFMLWQIAYTEFYFTPVHWPDFGKVELALAMQDYVRRQRRFGLIEDEGEPVATMDEA